jgi:hypothetical protein
VDFTVTTLSDVTQTLHIEDAQGNRLAGERAESCRRHAQERCRHLVGGKADQAHRRPAHAP